MPVQTLANTQWKLNSTVTLTGTFSFNVSGIAVSSIMYNITRIYVRQNSSGRFYLEARSTSGAAIQFASWSNAANAYVPSSAWDGFVIIGGEDCENQEFIDWLNQNATQQDLIFKSRAVAFEETANAIRAKGNTSAALSWSSDTGFKSAIDAIVFGADATAQSYDVKSGSVFYGNGNRMVGTMEDASGRSF